MGLEEARRRRGAGGVVAGVADLVEAWQQWMSEGGSGNINEFLLHFRSTRGEAISVPDSTISAFTTLIGKQEEAKPSATSEVDRQREIAAIESNYNITSEQATIIADLPTDQKNRILRSLSAGGGLGSSSGGSTRVEFPSEVGLREAQTAEIYQRMANEPMEQYLKRLSAAVKIGELQRDQAKELFDRQLQVDKARREAPGEAASALKTLGGMAVPSGYTFPLTGMQTEPQSLQPFIDAVMPQIPQEYMEMGPDPALMQQLAQAAAQMQAGSPLMQ